MKVRGLREVVTGVNQSLKAGEIADLDTATVNALLSSKAVEVVKDEPVLKPEDVELKHVPEKHPDKKKEK